MSAQVDIAICLCYRLAIHTGKSMNIQRQITGIRSKVRSPHDVTVFFLKSLLLSFWLGISLLAVLAMPSIATDVPLANGLPRIIAFVLLICGCAYAMGACFLVGVKTGGARNTPIRRLTESEVAVVKQKPRIIHVAGLAGMLLLLFAPAAYSTFNRHIASTDIESAPAHIQPAVTEVSTKCSEIAGLERKLFQSNEKTVMAECLMQYEQKHAGFRVANMLKK
ncbi:MAG: hypothetical protein H7315_13375 [Herminiimonas sp.]|nr:hypothetical protein [Herminiimonas sp.]